MRSATLTLPPKSPVTIFLKRSPLLTSLKNVGSFLRVPALLGRNIQPSDAEAANQQAMVVLSYDFWMRHYNGDRSVLGKMLELDHKPYSIVGVMPKDYTWEPDLYAPMSLLPTRERNSVLPIMKLKSGVSLDRANAEIDSLVHQFAKETPQYFPTRFRMHLEHITDRIVTAVGHALILLFVAVVMLLIIGCANCSILLLARGVNRQSELAVRAALGASRSRILGQLIVEALVLAVTGSLFGILLAYWMAKLIFSLFPDVFMHESVVRINLPILGFSIALALVSGLLSDCCRRFACRAPDVSKVMQAAGRKVAGRTGQARSLSTLIAAQIALTTIIMGAAGIAIGGFMQMTHRNFGYDPAHVMSVPVRSISTAISPARSAQHTLQRCRRKSPPCPESPRSPYRPTPLHLTTAAIWPSKSSASRLRSASSSVPASSAQNISPRFTFPSCKAVFGTRQKMRAVWR